LNRNINFTFIPIYGIAFGITYYNPNLEPEQLIKVDPEEYYEQVSIMFLCFGLHITVWKE
tara:strand:+ start:553 stop:732 length:180 start_codon:yes stop_codon:yes gene_type:complete